MSARVLYVVTQLGLGGAEVQVVDLARALKARGWDPAVLSMCHPVALTERLAEAGIPLRTLGLVPGQKTPRMFTRMIREVRASRPDILHTHTLPANLLGRLVRPLAQVPVLVTSAHNVNEGGAWKMALYRLTDGQADLTTNVSQRAVDRYVRIGAAPPGRIHRMPNGVDLAAFSPDPAVRRRMRAALGIDDDTFLWLAVGRLTVQKDYPNLVSAVKRLARGGAPRPFRVLVVGIGEEEASVRALVREEQVPIELLGLRKDVPDLMRAADAFVMSSAWEGLPVVLLEAAASALPIVATRVGGNDEIVTDDVTGLLLEPRDAGVLADAMGRLMREPPARLAEMGAAARERVRATYDLEQVVERWVSTYRSTLASAGRRGWRGRG